MDRDKKLFKKPGFYLLGLFFAVLLGSGFFLIRDTGPKEEPKTQKETVEEDPEEETEEAPPKIRESAYIEVPYTVQAPGGRWDVHEESCEEAAALMYYLFLVGDKNKNIPPKTADEEMLKMVSWQKKNYGREPDLGISAFGEFFKAYYGFAYKIEEKASKENIKKIISAGHPVIAPVMTHSLQNPHYGQTNSYHLLLIKGYDRSGVITNDAGIAQGRNYRYSWPILFGAIDAQTPVMNQGREIIYFF